MYLDADELASRRWTCPAPVAGPARPGHRVTQTETRSTCPYCGVGCGVIIQADGAQITGVRGDPEHPANFGRLCTKGSTLAPDRRAAPAQPARAAAAAPRGARPAAAAGGLGRRARRGGRRASRPPCRSTGPMRSACTSSGQLLTEDYYVFNKLAKGLLGTNNVDTNSRLCMSSAVAGYKQAWAPTRRRPATTTSAWRARSSSPARTWPGRTRCCSAGVEDARRANPELKLIVADPRRTETAARGRPAPAAAARHRRRAAPRAAARAAVGGPGRHGLHRARTPAASRPCATACASSRRRMRPRSAA